MQADLEERVVADGERERPQRDRQHRQRQLGERVERKPRVGTSRLSMRSHSTLTDRLPTVVPSRMLRCVSSGPAARISGSVWVVLRRL